MSGNRRRGVATATHIPYNNVQAAARGTSVKVPFRFSVERSVAVPIVTRPSSRDEKMSCHPSAS